MEDNAKQESGPVGHFFEQLFPYVVPAVAPLLIICAVILAVYMAKRHANQTKDGGPTIEP